MAEVLRIGKHEIGYHRPVFVIAEIGVNHNGDIKLAKKMIKAAAESGADCVKFQTFKAERVVTQGAVKAKYQLKTTDPEESQLRMLKKLELPQEAYETLIADCEACGVTFMSTPYNIEDIDFLDKIGVSAFKLASIHAAEPYIVEYAAKKGKSVILSTGMATLGEIDEVVRVFRNTGNEALALLQCTTNYPSAVNEANLRAMQSIAKAFDVITGYSDHTRTDTACIVSIGLGAKIIEKHFTLDKSLPGPDHSCSATPKEFTGLVKKIRDAEAVLGSPVKSPTRIERANAEGMRRSIVARKGIAKGEVFTSAMLLFKRPAIGISPRFFDEIIGRVAQRAIEKNAFIRWSDIGETI